MAKKNKKKTNQFSRLEPEKSSFSSAAPENEKNMRQTDFCRSNERSGTHDTQKKSKSDSN